MKKLTYIIIALSLISVSLLCYLGCGSEEIININKTILGKWCKPDIQIKGLPIGDLNAEEKMEYKFMLGGIEKIFEEMCIEYFNDRVSGRDSYKINIHLPDEVEEQYKFGEYELLAEGKRLVLYTNDNQQINIELTKLTHKEHQWRLQYYDMVRLGGSEVEIPEDLPNFVMYLTFSKEKK
jgi:hypothetical protein